MGDEALKAIARELVAAIQQHASVDWAYRQSGRARVSTIVKRILKGHKYPAEARSAATQTVLEQATTLSEQMGA